MSSLASSRNHMHTYTDMYMYIHIDVHIHAYTHTRTHTHTHTHVHMAPLRGHQAEKKWFSACCTRSVCCIQWQKLFAVCCVLLFGCLLLAVLLQSVKCCRPQEGGSPPLLRGPTRGSFCGTRQLDIFLENISKLPNRTPQKRDNPIEN